MKKSAHRISLQLELTLGICAIVFCVLLLLTLLANSLLSRTVRQKTGASLQREAELLRQNLQTLTSSPEDQAVMFSVDRNLQALLKQNSTAPVSSVQNYNLRKDLANIFVYLTGGRSAFSSIEIAFSDGTLANVGRFTNLQLDEPSIAQTKKTRHPVWQPPTELTTQFGLQKRAYTIYKSVYDLDGTDYLGCLILHVDARRVEQIFSVGSSETARFFLLNGKLPLTGAADAADPGFDEVWASPVLFPTGGADSAVRSATLPHWFAFSIPAQMDSWRILGAIPTSYMKREIQVLTSSIYAAGIAAVLLSVLFSIFLSRRIVAPVARLMHSVEELPLEDEIALPVPDASLDESYVTGQDLELMVDKTHELMTQIYQNQRLRNTLQFRVMQAQIKPHFLYNALETAASLCTLGMAQDAAAYIQSLSTFYRISLSSGRDLIPLEEELRLTACYLDIQKRRYLEFFDYEIQTPSPCPALTVPKLLLQPIVENAIYHGCKPKSAGGRIRLRAAQEHGCTVLSIEDNGVGMTQAQIAQLLTPSSAPSAPVSYGLRNALSRLRLVYADTARMQISSGVTNVTLLSASVGFSDPNYFSRCFKKRFSCSPSKYIESHVPAGQP